MQASSSALHSVSPLLVPPRVGKFCSTGLLIRRVDLHLAAGPFLRNFGPPLQRFFDNTLRNRGLGVPFAPAPCRVLNHPVLRPVYLPHAAGPRLRNFAPPLQRVFGNTLRNRGFGVPLAVAPCRVLVCPFRILELLVDASGPPLPGLLRV